MEPEPDTVSVRITGDAWKGDPTSALVVNGRAVPLSTVVASDHVGSPWDTFTFRRDFDLGGSDRVSVPLLNNLDDGPDRDCNLYVDRLALNGEVPGSTKRSSMTPR